MGSRNHLLRILIVGALMAVTCTAGCTSSTISQDPFLKAYLDYKYEEETNSGNTTTDWSVAWINATAVSLNYSVASTYTNISQYVITNITVQEFKTAEEASQFVDVKSSGYDPQNVCWADYHHAYQRVAGRSPSTCRYYNQYINCTGQTLRQTLSQTCIVHQITQYDHVVEYGTIRIDKYHDFADYLNKNLDKNWTMITPFTKTTNEYGNDVYVGAMKNMTGGYTFTESIELTKNETEAKDHFAKYIASKLNQGYAAYDPSDYGISMKGKSSTAGPVSEEWFGRTGINEVRAFYGYNPALNKWWFMVSIPGPKSTS